MRLLVVGSVAFDSVKTPFGEAEEVLGGSATYFSVAASFFTPISLVAVVGEDFPKEEITSPEILLNQFTQAFWLKRKKLLQISR